MWTTIIGVVGAISFIVGVVMMLWGTDPAEAISDMVDCFLESDDPIGCILGEEDDTTCH